MGKSNEPRSEMDFAPNSPSFRKLGKISEPQGGEAERRGENWRNRHQAGLRVVGVSRGTHTKTAIRGGGEPAPAKKNHSLLKTTDMCESKECLHKNGKKSGEGGQKSFRSRLEPNVDEQ